MTVSEETVKKSAKGAGLRLGWIVIAALAVLTAVEFWLALAVRPATLWLIPIALAKAGLIVEYFMHVSQLRGAEEGH